MMGRSRNNQSDEAFDETVIAPRFDQRAISGARRVVPITDETEEATRASSRNRAGLRSPYLLSFPKPSWPLALMITLALVAVAAGGVAINRRSATPLQNQEPASVTAYTVIDAESDESAASGRNKKSLQQRPGSRGGDGYDRHNYYGALPAVEVDLIEGRGGHGKFMKGKGRGEENSRGKEDKWRDKEKGGGKGRRGKGGE